MGRTKKKPGFDRDKILDEILKDVVEAYENLDTVQRPEGVDAGTLRLVGTDEEEIYTAFTELLDDPEAYAAMSGACNPYGDGHACERIADILEGKEYEEWEPK